MNGEKNSSGELLKDGSLFEKYRIERLLGRGGMGAVYLARHTVLDSLFALKVLFPSIALRNQRFVSRFIREAKLACKLKHPNLIEVHDAGINPENGMHYIVMEYVSGGSVRDLLKKVGHIAPGTALGIVRQVASALEAARKLGMVHRDIKPDNIMFAADSTVKLADLGIAKSTSEQDTLLTLETSVFGTPAYMSPEQALDSRKVDTRADIYSLGIVLFEMLSGKRPFRGESSIEILSRVISPEEIPDIRLFRRDLPDSLAGLLGDMCAKNLQKRIPSPSALLERLEPILGELEENPPGSLSETALKTAAPFVIRPPTLTTHPLPSSRGEDKDSGMTAGMDEGKMEKMKTESEKGNEEKISPQNRKDAIILPGDPSSPDSASTSSPAPGAFPKSSAAEDSSAESSDQSSAEAAGEPDFRAPLRTPTIHLQKLPSSAKENPGSRKEQPSSPHGKPDRGGGKDSSSAIAASAQQKGNGRREKKSEQALPKRRNILLLSTAVILALLCLALISALVILSGGKKKMPTWSEAGASGIPLQQTADPQADGFSSGERIPGRTETPRQEELDAAAGIPAGERIFPTEESGSSLSPSLSSSPGTPAQEEAEEAKARMRILLLGGRTEQIQELADELRKYYGERTVLFMEMENFARYRRQLSELVEQSPRFLLLAPARFYAERELSEANFQLLILAQANLLRDHGIPFAFLLEKSDASEKTAMFNRAIADLCRLRSFRFLNGENKTGEELSRELKSLLDQLKIPMSATSSGEDGAL